MFRWTLGLTLCGLLLAAATVGHAEERAPGAPIPVGSAMRDFGLRAVDLHSGTLGAMIWLSDFVGDKPRRAPKKALVLSFFAVWCQPCIDELPVLARLQEQYAAAGLQVLGVHVRADGEAVDEALAKARALWRQKSPGFPLLFDRYTDRNPRIYAGDRAVLPCNVLIDASGTVAARFQGGKDRALSGLEARVRRQLGVAP